MLLGTGVPPQYPCEYPLGVQPPQRPCMSSVTPNPWDLTPGGPNLPPIYVIPYPLQVGPNPGSCPCYLVQPENNNTTPVRPATPAPRPPPPPPTQPSNQMNYPPNYNPGNQMNYPPNYSPPYGIIGFIPVVFFPYCPGNTTDLTAVQNINPGAVQVPYPCSQCNQNQGQIRFLDLGANGGDSFRQVLAQAGVGLFDGNVRSPHRRSMRVRNSRMRGSNNS